MFYSVFLQKMFKLAADKTGAVVRDDQLWDPKLSEESSHDLDDGRGRGRWSADGFDPLRVGIDHDEKVFPFEWSQEI